MQKLQPEFFLSIVLPIYNEEKRILPTLQKTTQFVRSKNISCEYVIVDDGSRDHSLPIIQDFFGPHPTLKILRGFPNRGKGWAVREGMLSAQGEYVLFMDADLSVPIETLESFIQKMEEGWDIIIGSRRTKNSKILKHQSFIREELGKQFTRLSNAILGTQVSDFTCGFKLFKRESAQILFKEQRLFNWSFDAEILFLAKKHGLKIAEYPVQWSNSVDTKVNLLRDVPSSFLGLLKVRLFHS